jgi:hypothetical protein
LSKSRKPAAWPRARRWNLAGGAVSIVASLIYFEQIAVLYVLATLGLVTLLLTVAFADLESVGEEERVAAETSLQTPAEESGKSTEVPTTSGGTNNRLRTSEVMNVDY